MVSAMDSRSSSLCSIPGQVRCVVFLGQAIYSHSASLHPGVHMDSGEFNAGPACTTAYDGPASHPGASRNTPRWNANNQDLNSAEE